MENEQITENRQSRQNKKRKFPEWLKAAITLISILGSLAIFYALFIILAITKISSWILLAPLSSMLIVPTAFYTKKSKSKTVTLLVMLGVIVLSVGYTTLRYFLGK